jgi:hypothetical protein
MKFVSAILTSITFALGQAAIGATLSLQPKNFTAGAYVVQDRDGVTAWVPSNNEGSLYFDVPEGFPRNVPVYVEIVYLDEGRGYLFVEYDSAYGSTVPDRHWDAELHTRSSRVGSGEWVTSYQVFKNPVFANRQSGQNDFRMKLQNPSAEPLRVASVRISTDVFPDERLHYILSGPWLQPPAGEVRDWVDNQSVRGKVMSGYQGWFSAPNDLMDRGWNHWGRSRGVDPSPTEITIDMWPWMDEYRPEDIYRAGEMVLQDGRPAYLFSSSDLDTVRTHFRWMRRYNIDGVYLQRFVNTNNSGYYGAKEFVLSNVRQAAREEGRVWAIEYDVSSLSPTADPFTVIKNDWNWLVNEVGILGGPRYLHEDGKPVLFIWGFSANGRNFTLAQANEIVDWFRAQDLYLIGGVPNNWEDKADWHGHYQRYDQLLGWQSRSDNELRQEAQLLQSWGMKLLPHVWPGFSWTNLQKLQPGESYTARRRGSFYWECIRSALRSGADQLFLGMFDEYDEGTAIMPMTDNHPLPHTQWGQYIDNSGREPFWWLRLSGYANELLDGARPYAEDEPTEDQVYGAGYTGPDATIYLGANNREEGLFLGAYHDGGTVAATYGRQDCRSSIASPDLVQYLYFDVEESFLPANRSTVRAMIEAEVFAPEPGTTVKLQYDSFNADYTVHPIVATPLDNAWVTLRWFVDDAAFRNSQNAGTDFRLNIARGKALAVRRVSVFLPDDAPGHADSTVRLDLQFNTLHWSERLDATGWRLHQSSNLSLNSWTAVADNALSFTGDGSVQFALPFTSNPQFFVLKRER